MADALTILTVQAGYSASKVFRRIDGGGWLKLRGFDAGSQFRHRSVPVGSIYDICDVLEALARNEFPIRGHVKPEYVDHERVTRTKKTIPAKRQVAMFDEVERQWLMGDFDDVSMPSRFDLIDDPQGAVEWLISEHLPEQFHNVTCVWQLSSSAGMTPSVINVHIWFWLDRKIANLDLKAWLKIHAPKVDGLLFQAVQPHFVAPPAFEGGDGKSCPDPLPRRMALLERGHDFVTMPRIDRPSLEEQWKALRPAGSVTLGNTAEERLAAMGDGPGLNGFHAPARDSTMAAVRAGLLNDLAGIEAWKARVRGAIQAAPKRFGRDVTDYMGDAYLDASIQGAIARRQSELIEVERRTTEEEVSLADGEQILEAAVLNFLAKARDHNPSIDGPGEVHVVAAELGLGKTEVTLNRLARNYDLGSRRVHFYTPQQKLAREVVDRFNAARPAGTPPARLWQGRSRVDDHGKSVIGENGQPTCFDEVRPKADVFARAGVSVSKHFCPACPHASECGWQYQRQDAGPGLVVMPQQYAFETNAKLADMQIFDEGFWQAAMRETSVALGSLYGGELDDARSKLYQALKSANGGVPTLPQLREAGVTAGGARWAAGAEHKRADTLASKLKPKMSLAALTTVVEKFPFRDSRRWARIWTMIAAQIDFERERLHGFRLRVKTDEDGDRKLLLMGKWSRKLQNPDIPTLLLDATASRAILGSIFTREIDVWTDVSVAAPHARVVQVADRVVGKAMIVPDPDRDKTEELKRKRNRAADVAKIVEVAAAGQTYAGLITYKATEDEIAASLPENVTTGHFNAIRGLDAWRDVDALVIAGRTQPSEGEVEHIAEGLFYDQDIVIEQVERYAKTEFDVVVGDQVRTIDTDAHPDPLVEAVRWQICEGELLQAIGRARAIRRAGDDPVEIVLVTSVPVLPHVDALVPWADLVPGHAAVMAARGFVPCNAADMARAYPDLFKNQKAARNWKNRQNGEECLIPLCKLYIGKRGTPRAVFYHPPGRGQKRRRGWITVATDDPAAFVMARLGIETPMMVSPELAAPPAGAEIHDFPTSVDPSLNSTS